MPCKIIVANKCNYPRGYIIAIVDESHTFSHKETLAEHLNNGGSIETWQRPFSLINITDKTKKELEHLLEPYVLYATDPPEEVGRKYSFIEPSIDSELYESLLNTGEVSVNFATAEQYIVTRS
jgi:hypothetical protein